VTTASFTAAAPTPRPHENRTTGSHPWRVVAPWYRWARADGAEPGRAAEAGTPALHKFGSTSFVADFLRDPQRSVVFDEALDVVQRIENIPAAELNGADGRLRKLGRRRLVPTQTRKLFQPAHQRFYLLAVGVHCDAPGFPKVDPASIEEVGFVIRRRTVKVPSRKRAKGAALLAELTQARAVAGSKLELDVAKSRARVLHPFTSASRDRVLSPSTATKAAYREAAVAQRRLRVWAATEKLDLRNEAWVPTGEGDLGAWVPMIDEPEEVAERSYPMRLLSPNPDDPDHAASDGTIYFAAVPTASSEITERGEHRFSERDTYEIRVFVRRRCCGHCPGVLVWSEPTRLFRMASFFDPAGCALRPSEVRLPNFAELEASDALPSVRVTQPPGSSLDFSKFGEIPTKGKTGAAEQICFFSIPLITIIAMFVLNLALPIVMFVFQLWWMLKLKFCIPPSIQFEADLAAELDVTPPELKAEVELEVDIDVRTGVDQAGLRQVMEKVFDPPADPELDPVPADWRLGQVLGDTFTNDPLVRLAVRNGYGSSADPAPTFSLPITWTTRVRREEVVHP
jgi:hypothetical protein